MAASSVSGLTGNGVVIEVEGRVSDEAIVSLPAVCMDADAADGAGAWGDIEEILVLLASLAFKDGLSTAVEILVPGAATPVISSADDPASGLDVLSSAAELEVEILEANPRPGSVGTSAFTVDDGVFDGVLAVFCSMKAAPGLTKPSVEVLASETLLEDVAPPAAARLVAATEIEPPDDADDTDDVPAGARPT